MVQIRIRLLIICLLFLLIGCTSRNPTYPIGLTSAPTNTEGIFTITPSQTSTYSIVEEITPTPLGIQQTPDPTQMDISRWESTSPDGNWIAIGIYASPKSESSLGLDYQQLIIENSTQAIRWEVIDMWRETGLGGTSTQPVKWSSDGKYFYFTNVPSLEGCRALTINGSDLQRVDLANGNVYEILSNVAYWILLSPNESLLAYIMQGSGNLWIRNISSADEKEININPGLDFDAGNIVWSPNSQFLALTVANLPCTGDYLGSGIYAESTSLIIINSSTFELRNILTDDKRRFITSTWNEDNEIELIDPEGNLWILNVTNGTINQK